LAFDVVEDADCLTDKLDDPNRARIGLRASSTDVPIEADGQKRIASDFAHTALPSGLCKLPNPVGSLERFGVVAAPNVPVAFGIALKIELALLIEDRWKPRVIAPVGFHDDGIVGLLLT